METAEIQDTEDQDMSQVVPEDDEVKIEPEDSPEPDEGLKEAPELVAAAPRRRRARKAATPSVIEDAPAAEHRNGNGTVNGTHTLEVKDKSMHVVENLKASIANALAHRQQLAAQLRQLDEELATAGIHIADGPAPTVGTAIGPAWSEGSNPKPRARRARKAAPTAAAPKAPRKASGERMARRSNAEIDAAVEKVVHLVKQSKTGLRAEEIKTKLGMDRREVPRVLKAALAAKQLKTTGQKRATCYHAR